MQSKGVDSPEENFMQTETINNQSDNSEDSPIEEEVKNNYKSKRLSSSISDW